MSQCAPYAGINDTACGQTYLLQGNLSQPGSVSLWTTSSPGVLFVDATQTSTEVFIPGFTVPVINISFVFTETNTSIPCTNSDTVVITFIKPPHSEGGTNHYVCGTTAQLQADTIASGIVYGYWSSNVPGISIIPGGQPPFPEAHIDASSLLPGFWNNSSREVYFYWTGYNNYGCTSTDSVKITFYEIPVANAGLDTVVCGKSWDMSGNWSINNYSGIWSTQINSQPPPPGFSNFIPINNPDAFVSVTEYGVYSFIWKEMNAGNTTCLDRDTVTVHFLAVPTPDAGLDFSVCGNFAHIVATSSPGSSGGQWSCPTGGIAYYDGINGNFNNSYRDSASSYIRYSSENDTVTMYWCEFNGVCFGFDTLNVYFGSIQPAIQLVDPIDSLVCGPTFTLLNAQIPSYGAGHWIDSQQNSTFSPSPNIANPSVTINNGTFGYHDFYWITVNGLCTDTSEAVPVNFIESPIANAGGNYWPGLFGGSSHIKTDTVCGLNYQMAPIPSIGNGIWSTTYFNAEFNLTNNISTTYPFDSLYLQCGGSCYSVFSSGVKYYQFIWQENNNGCVHSDTLRLYFAPSPTGTLTATTPACRHLPFTSQITATTWPLPNNVNYGITEFHWNYGNGVLLPYVNDTISPNIFVGWSSGDQHSVSLTTVNQWGCESETNTIIVNEPPLLSPPVTVVSTTCMQNNGEIILSSGGGSYTFYWTPASDYVNPTAYSQSNLLPNSYHSVVVAGQTLSPDTFGIMCHDTISIFVPDSSFSHLTGQLISSPTIDYSAFEIKAYRVANNAEATLVKTIPLTSSGIFDSNFPSTGDFYIQARLVQANNNIPFANSYYLNEYEWANAAIVPFACLDTVNLNIPLVNYSPAVGGLCRIYGLVRYDGTLAPVENATVYMRYQPNQDPARFVFTNQNGYYSINNIPNGNYKLFVDIPGLPQVTNHHILINPNDTVFANVNFIVDTTSINKDYGFGIYADTTSLIHVPLNQTDFLNISVFPIPFQQQLNLSCTLSKPERISAELIDIRGITLFNIENQLFEKGDVNLNFPTTQLESGTYFLKIEIENNVYVKKILKVN